MDNHLRVKEILEGLKPQINFDSEDIVLNEGILDSLDIIRLVMELEKGFGIKIESQDLKKENFKDINEICLMIKAKQD